MDAAVDELRSILASRGHRDAMGPEGGRVSDARRTNNSHAGPAGKHSRERKRGGSIERARESGANAIDVTPLNLRELFLQTIGD